MVKSLGSEKVDKPINVRLAQIEDLLRYDYLILGTSTYGDGELPGLSTGNMTESWEEFLPKIKGADFSGKKIALYGLGDQQKYGGNFSSAMRDLYDEFSEAGAQIIGLWPLEGYEFKYSKAVINNHFVGLVLDEENQRQLTQERVEQWLSQLDESWVNHG